MNLKPEFDTYAEAAKIDLKINEMLEKFPPTDSKENANSWLLFSRTIRTGLDIIDKTSNEVLGLKNDTL